MDFTAKKWRDGKIDDPDEVISQAARTGVTRLVCVGTDVKDSERAVDFVRNRKNCWTAVGIHPHESKKTLGQKDWADRFSRLLGKEASKIAAIGECGLDYYYEHSPKKEQIQLLEQLLDLAAGHDLPVIFHVREAFDDFWPIYDNFKGLAGVLHSFSSDSRNLEMALNRGLYLGLNGIMTFTKDPAQLEAAKAVPADRLLLETDAPYLAPAPFRGKVCRPEHIKTICEFLCGLRSENFDELASQTTQNAKSLFDIC